MKSNVSFGNLLGEFLMTSKSLPERFVSRRRAMQNVREVMRHMPGGAFSGERTQG
ncbi:hypothetical protein LJC31_06605 [Synergistaceae bacterium OttesenSCG-928-I11]|nr:hypothetical protein [Synergistaceae bacterium OttesenSCG-928-I11]